MISCRELKTEKSLDNTYMIENSPGPKDGKGKRKDPTAPLETKRVTMNDNVDMICLQPCVSKKNKKYSLGKHQFYSLIESFSIDYTYQRVAAALINLSAHSLLYIAYSILHEYFNK